MLTKGTIPINRIIRWQLLISLLAVGISILFGGSVAVSVISGCATAMLLNLLFVNWFFGPYRADRIDGLISRMYLVQTGRLLTAMLLFGLASAWIEPLNIGAMLVSFAVVHIVPSLITN